LHVLSAGAAKALVTTLADRFRQVTGHAVSASFDAVGATLERFRAGADCDVIILTRSAIDALVAAGSADSGAQADLGWVRTGVAVPAGAAAPDVTTAAGLRTAILQCSALYLPDPQRATAGIHCMQVLAALGLSQVIAARLRPHPNGAAAMTEMARAGDRRALGITQVTEILYSPGVRLVGALPKEFELATLYSAARAQRSRQTDAAAQFIGWLGGEYSAALRRAGGFE
jgi:molybdate transport system substrate-binding protein